MPKRKRHSKRCAFYYFLILQNFSDSVCNCFCAQTELFQQLYSWAGVAKYIVHANLVHWAWVRTDCVLNSVAQAVDGVVFF